MRDLLPAFAGLLLLACGLTAPPAPKPPVVIGVIQGVSPDLARPRVDALRAGLESLGYRDGRDIVLEIRYLEAKGQERAAEITGELIALGAALIVTGNPAAVEGARKTTSTVPIVLAGVGSDPVGSGWVASLAHPGGNVTGLSFQIPTITGRRLQLMKEIFPAATRIGLLLDASATGITLAEHEEAARSLGLTLQTISAREPAEIEMAFTTFRLAGIASVGVVVSGAFAAQLPRIASAALANRIATSSGVPDGARAGGLLALGPDQADLYRRAASYVDKILKGAKPGDLPLAQPEKFDLILNMRTAASLGLTVPESVLAQASELIR